MGTAPPFRRVLDLEGAAYDRGRAQAELCPDRVAEVTVAVTRRLRALGPALAAPSVVAWLDAQHAFMRENDPDGFVEVQGIAEGFGIAPDALFACLFAEVVADLARAPRPSGSATVLAAPQDSKGALIVKNRDSPAPARDLQCVFRHSDPDWGGRRILCVGSLGSPGALSSGINSDGLAVADSPVATADHGCGWLRGFLMTRILRECASVADAVGLVFRAPHAGGGTLLLADATGAVAAIELTHGAVAAEEPGEREYVARTNHFVSDRLRGRDAAAGDDAFARASRARMATLEHALRGLPVPYAEDGLRTIMARHGDSASAGLCRHDGGNDAETLSCAIHDCRGRALSLSFGPPCEGHWERLAP